MKYIVAIAKNEYFYISDWVNWHLERGFDKIIIYNNSDSFRPMYCERCKLPVDKIAEIDIRGKIGMQMPAYTDSVKYLQPGDYALYIDIDEFLEFEHVKNIDEFIKSLPEFDVCYINWKVYGNNGEKYFVDKPVYERFKIPAPIDAVYNDSSFIPKGVTENWHVKSLVHCTANKKLIPINHCWNAEPDPVIVNAVGDRVRYCCPWQPIVWKNAWLNHYITKSTEEFIDRRINALDTTGNLVDTETVVRRFNNLNGNILKVQ